jgi:hypothetical protein
MAKGPLPMQKTQVALPVLFFLGFYLFVWRLIEPMYIYYINGIYIKTYVVECTFDYFLHAINFPGGLARYLASWLTHLFYWSWLGAAALTAMGFVLYLLSCRIFKRYGLQGRFIHFIPAILLLLTYCFYAHGYAVTFIQVTGLLTFVVLFDYLPVKSGVLYYASLTLCSWLAWFLFGWGWPLFSFLALPRNVSRLTYRFVTFGVYTFCNGALQYLVEQNLWDVVDVFGPARANLETWLTVGGFLYFPFVLMVWKLLTPLSGGVSKLRHPRKRRKDRRSRPENPLAAVGFRMLPVISAGLFCVVVYTTFYFVYNPLFKQLAAATHFAQSGQWSRLLKTCSGPLLQKSPVITTHYLIQALYHTGQLGSRLFCYPLRQSSEPLLMWNDLRQGYTASIPISLEALLALGAVNTAEKNAYETLEIAGLPFVLRDLCLTNLAKGHPETARVFADNLAKAPFRRADARVLQTACADTSPAARLPEATLLAGLMERSDTRLLLSNSEEPLLINLLENNPANRMAYEYLLTHYLLTVQIDKFATRLSQMSAYKYDSVPRHWQEALLVYLFNTPSPNPALLQIPIDPAVQQNFMAFNQLYALHRNNIGAVHEEMYRRFGNTYYYFFVFSTPE